MNKFVRTCASSVPSILGSGGAIMLCEGGGTFVDLVFWNVCFQCPCTNAIDLSRYLFTESTFDPGQIAKNPCVIAAIQVDLTGQKQH